MYHKYKVGKISEYVHHEFGKKQFDYITSAIPGDQFLHENKNVS